MEVIPSTRGVDVALNVDGSDLTLGLPAETEAELRMLPVYNISMQMTGSGSTVRELASTANGYFRLVSAEGRVPVATIALLGRDFIGEVVGAINPFMREDPYSDVRCLAVLVEAVDGIVIGHPAVVFQTDKLNISAVAKIDLSTEELHASFHTQAREGIGIGLSDLTTPFAEIDGTLANPSIQLQSVEHLVEGATKTGLSFISDRVKDRLFSDRNPCTTAVQLADEERANRE